MKTPPPTPLTRPVLEAARGLLSVEGVWIKGHSSTDRLGNPVGYWDERACRFSLDGAILRSSHVMRAAGSGAYLYLKLTIHPKGILPVAHWNDAQETTIVAVIKLLNTAIEALGGEPLDPWAEDGA